MDAEKNFREVGKIKKLFHDKMKEQYRADSGNRLAKSIERKFRTTFIGSISHFEEAFGAEWGHRQPEETLNAEQLRKRKLWEQVRTNILNNGNNQLRAAQAEIAEYNIEWNKHQLNIPVRDINRGNENG